VAEQGSHKPARDENPSVSAQLTEGFSFVTWGGVAFFGRVSTARGHVFEHAGAS